MVVKPVDSSTGNRPVELTFSNVTQGGTTTLSTSSTGPAQPAGFKLGDPPRYYELSTTASFSGKIKICIQYTGINFPNPPPRLFHYEAGAWTDVTTSVDTVNEIICGEVSSLSPFALFVENRPPVANAGPDQTRECPGVPGASVTLDASESFDPDHDPLSYTWTGSFVAASGAAPTVELPIGDHTVTLTVSDGVATAQDSVRIVVRDTTPPAITQATADPAVLAPPNHKMIPVKVSVSAIDICDAAPACRIVSVTSNEPENGLGDGDAAPDAEITGELTVKLRAERSAKGSGRSYTITILCTDASANSSTRTVVVTVPHDKPPK